MQIAACLNIHINDQAPVLIAFEEDFSQIVEDYPSMTKEQLGALTLLSTVFDVRTNKYWEWNLPFVSLSNTSSILIGQLEDFTTNALHPKNSLTLLTYTPESLKDSFKKRIPPGLNTEQNIWDAMIEDTAFEDLSETLMPYFPHLDYLSLVEAPLNVSFSSVSAEDLSDYMAGTSGAASSYEDALPWLKSFVDSNTNVLDTPNSTTVQTVSSAEGDEMISFNTRVYMAAEMSQPDSEESN